jgi:cytochrome c-type biogenesis protein CcmE
MKKNRRFLIGGVIILGVLGYLVYGGMQEAVVYFVTPSELKAGTTPPDRFLRVGGMVLIGSLEKDLSTRTFNFEITDGAQSIPVRFQGVPPDLFSEGKGAVVEGRFGSDGVFRANLVMAKHAEEYSPHKEGEDPSKRRSFVPGRISNSP